MLQGLINKALEKNQQAASQLEVLNGKSLRIECLEPAIDVTIDIDSPRINLSSIAKDSVNTHIQGKLSDFAEILAADDKAAAIINADVRLIGDSQLLIQLQQALTSTDVDWEYQLAKIIGDVPAHFFGKMGRTTADHLGRLKPIFLRHLQEFIQEETKASPRKDEIQQWQSENQKLRQQMDRIEAKLNSAKKKLQDI